MNHKLAILLIIALLSSGLLQAKEDTYHIYAALGFGYSPSSLRFAAHDIESGLLAVGTNGASIGAIKLFRSNTSFAGFGLAFRFTNAIGFHGAVGKSFRWFDWLRFRIEFNGEVYTDSFTQGNALVGLEFPW
jgi:hypothetical protein